MYDKHLLMLYSTYDQHLRLDGWHCLFTCSVFLWFGFFIEKLVRNEDGPPRKLLYKENGKKKVQITVVQQQQFRRSDFQKVFFFFFLTDIVALVFLFIYIVERPLC